jgi:predicted PurR-regulated permease PerM
MTQQPSTGNARESAVHPTVALLGAYAWRLLAIGAVTVAAVWLIGRLLIVVLPLIAALLLARVLTGPKRWLVDHRWPPIIATWLVLLGFIGSIALGGLFVPQIGDEFTNVGTSLTEAADRVEEWITTERPFGLDPADVAEVREQVGSFVTETLISSTGALVSGAVLVVEVMAGLVLSLVIAFFLIKDGERINAWALARLPARQRPLAKGMAAATWSTLGSFLFGAAMLGVVEALAIGLTLALVGAPLVLPLMLVTFLGAFIPFLGALLSGAVAALVTLATVDLRAAAIVALVAVLVQQFDGDLLAPAIYGRALQLHPLVVLIAVAAGTALFGLVGAFLAVPVVAVAVAVTSVVRASRTGTIE